MELNEKKFKEAVESFMHICPKELGLPEQCQRDVTDDDCKKCWYNALGVTE